MTFQRAVPAFPVHDIARAVEWYSAKLGFACPHQQDGFARLVRDDVELHLWKSADESWKTRADAATKPVDTGAESFIAGTHSCRIEVSEIDALFAECRAKGVLHEVTLRDGVVDQPWGRELHVVDLHRNLITFHQRHPERHS